VTVRVRARLEAMRERTGGRVKSSRRRGPLPAGGAIGTNGSAPRSRWPFRKLEREDPVDENVSRVVKRIEQISFLVTKRPSMVLLESGFSRIRPVATLGCERRKEHSIFPEGGGTSSSRKSR